MGRHRNKMKNFLVHNSSTLQPHSVRLLLVLSRVLDYDLWKAYITQAYLQSVDPLLSDIYITKEISKFELNCKQWLMLLKPLYGLGEVGDLWASTVDKHHRLDLGTEPFRSEAVLYVSYLDDEVDGSRGSCVNDLFRIGSRQFRKHCRKFTTRSKWAKSNRFRARLLDSISTKTPMETSYSTRSRTSHKSRVCSWTQRTLISGPRG